MKSGRVLSAARCQASGDALVEVLASDGAVLQSTRTDSNGRFQLEDKGALRIGGWIYLKNPYW